MIACTIFIPIVSRLEGEHNLETNEQMILAAATTGHRLYGDDDGQGSIAGSVRAEPSSSLPCKGREGKGVGRAGAGSGRSHSASRSDGEW